jgi:hypothetical protein
MRVSASLSPAVMQVRISDRRLWPTFSRRRVSANDRLASIVFARTSPESQDLGEIDWRRQMHGANVAGGPVGWAAISLLRCQLRLAVQSNTRNRLRLCKRPCCPRRIGRATI